MQQATNAILRGGTILAPTVSAKTIAEQLAEKINAKLNYVPLEKQEEERQDGGQNESFKRYEEELEINDFPQASNNFKPFFLFWSKNSCFLRSENPSLKTMNILRATSLFYLDGGDIAEMSFL